MANVCIFLLLLIKNSVWGPVVLTNTPDVRYAKANQRASHVIAGGEGVSVGRGERRPNAIYFGSGTAQAVRLQRVKRSN
ncbi:hypothetical protein GCM10023156_18550 [Novipirellula rosea]|uniref:Secreted protein n=1 Tax=Novipirellula rosea TaxID=1031540 RepID=A0ABP8MLZ3_9BACT